MAIFDFNTPATIGAPGTAVSQINQQVLRQIGVTVRNAEMCIRDSLSALPAGEKAVLELVALRLLCAVAQPHIYSETVEMCIRDSL